MVKSRFLIYAIFMFIAISVTTLLILEKNHRIEQFLKNKTVQYIQNYEALYNDYLKLSHIIFDTKINKPEVIKIFKDAKSATIDEQISIRENLYKSLIGDYNILKKYNLKQLHFHLPNNVSFLRFHRPNKFGDDLTDIRSTIKYTNQYQKFISGFEEGRIYNGYRFVFPLFDHEEYIGSVEVSFNTLAMTLELMKNYNLYANFLINKDVVASKVFDDEQKNYKPTMFKHFFIEKEMAKTIEKLYKKESETLYSKKTIQYIDANSLDNNSFSIYDEKSQKVLTLIKVQNPVTKKVVSSFLIQSNSDYILNKTQNFYTVLFSFLILLLLIMFFVQKRIQSIKIIELNNQKLTSIFQEAQAGIGIYDFNGNFTDVNTAFIEFLGYDKDEFSKMSIFDISTEESKKEIQHIQDTLEHNSYISKQRISCSKKNGKQVTLEISISKLPIDHLYIIIANSMEDKLKLEQLNKDLENKIKEAVEENSKKDAILHNQSKMAALGDMLGNIAHQWRQPLSIISTVSTGMKMQKEFGTLEDKELIDNLDIINEHTQYLSKTIDDFKLFIKGTNELKIFNLSDIFQKIVNIVKPTLDQHFIKLEIDIDPSININNYQDEFIQAMINILQNAKDVLIEQNLNDKVIIVTAEKNGSDDVILTIQDNGGGVPKKIQDKIFEPYFTTKHQNIGTGLGLHMTYKIITETMESSIEVENRTFIYNNTTYKGAAFIVNLKNQ